VWFSNGIHHHYSNDKIKPDFTQSYFIGLMKSTNTSLDADVIGIIFFNDIDDKKSKLNESKGLPAGSAINFAKRITVQEAEAFYKKKTNSDSKEHFPGHLNSKLIRNAAGELEEKF
jgi:dipeptidyl-peptidase-3